MPSIAVLIAVPRLVKDAAHARVTSDPATAYSTIVRPVSSCQKAFNIVVKVFMKFS
jgi:hypothetical protein